MGEADHALTLHTVQSDAVLAALEREGVCYSRERFIQEKYGESAPIFLTAYRWFAREAQRLVPRPPGAELPYWAFADPAALELSGGGRVLTLRVPPEEALLFDSYDWNKVLRLQYMGEVEADERRFRAELRQRGLRESDVLLTPFYPELRERVLQSWQRLFRHHARLRAGDWLGVGGVQAALWQLKSEWIMPQ